ncbi:MAG TPA: folylpolyglutamate synthase/dihydrofolate synthase family protein [Thermoanaerobaculia bacterium]|nr:folylpolyglutamate synthase/dihydrofolate synthase family protein [Thermoanaerobaculia bacterium]
MSWLDSLERFKIALGLSRVRKLLRALGHPEDAYRSVIIAGTNGKGSTAATLASIFRASGQRTGLYTSPAVVDERERWQIDGAWIEPMLLDECLAELRATSERIGITPTYFEALTIVAFLAFAKMKCDVAVLEVGMGGRLDATNVVRPIAALITPIALDHTEFLGNTLRKIAREKAGVIHRGAIVLTTNDDEAVLDVLRKRAAKFGNRFIRVTEEHDTRLPGDFQRRNAALAVRAARELGIEQEAIERGVRDTRWRGRLECIRVADKDVWIDGGHNAHAANVIATFIEEHVPRPRLLVFGVMQDKDVAAVTTRLFPLFDRVIATEPLPPRSAKAESFAGATPIANPDDAFRFALQSSEPSIVVTGSLYLAGAALRFFDKIARP